MFANISLLVALLFLHLPWKWTSQFTHTNMTSSIVRSHVFTKLMILAISSVRMTIYRELRDLGRNNHHSERLQTEY